MREIWTNTYIGPQAKWPLFLSDVDDNWIFFYNFPQNIKYKISQKSIQ